MFEEVFIISQRGDVLVSKSYILDATFDASSKFTDWIKESRTQLLLPVKEQKGHFFFHIKVSTYYLVGTTKDEKVQPFAAIEFLSRIKGLLKDFCGSLTEEAIILNRTLILELLDEVVDYGFIRTTSTKSLKPYIQQAALPVRQSRQQHTVFGLGPGLFGADFQSAPSTAANKPMTQGQDSQAINVQRNEIFLDVVEKLSAVVASNGTIVTSDINGSIQVRSFLSGAPELKLCLNDGLVAGKPSQVGYGNQLRVDHLELHPAVKLDHSHQTKTMSITPPEGEFTLMKYNISCELQRGLPFLMSITIDESDDTQELNVDLRLQCLLPENISAINIRVTTPVPADTKSVAPSLSSRDHNFQFDAKDNKTVWKIKKMTGGTEFTAKLRVQFNSVTSSSRSQVGPVNLEFEVKDWTCSSLQINYLKVFDPQKSYVPQRWVRYVTHSKSYTFRTR